MPKNIGATSPDAYIGDVINFYIPRPPQNIQSGIKSFVSQTVEQLDSLTDTATSIITLLQERRSALILAAVTGKFDLRDFDDDILA